MVPTVFDPVAMVAIWVLDTQWSEYGQAFSLFEDAIGVNTLHSLGGSGDAQGSG